MPGSSRWENTSVDESYSNVYEQPPPSAPPKQAPQQSSNVNPRVLVTKLKEGTTLGHINATFKKFGELEDIAFGESQSEAIVQFTYPEGAAAALKEEVIHCAGKTVFVHPYHSNMVPSSKQATSKPAPSKSSYLYAPQPHSGYQQHHYQSNHYHQSAPPMQSSQDYFHKPAPPSKQYASPPPSSNHYPSGYYPAAEPKYSSHTYHQSPPPNHYHQSPPPKHNPYKGVSSQCPPGYGNYSQPQKEVNYSSKSYGFGSGGSGGGSSFSKNTGQKMDKVNSENIEKHKFVDLCFMIDATSSMSPHLALTVQSIKDIVSIAQKKMNNRIIRLAFVAYRDYPESTAVPVVEHLNFTQDVDHFMTSLSKIQALNPPVGNGDICEDVVSGLLKVQELERSSNTRILFWIADAPCHGEQFNSGCSDDYAKAPPQERPAYSEKELLGKLKFLNIRNFFFLKINNTTDKMIDLFKGMFDCQGFELKQETINGNKSGFIEQVVGSVMYSVNFQKQ